MPHASLNDVSLFYVDEGDPEAPAVVFNHGFLMDHTMFDAQVRALRGEFRCVRWDQRGFGESSASGPFSYWDSARDCLALMDLLDIESAVLVGMSQGGFIALRAALLAPERIDGLVLIDTMAGVDPEEVYESFRALRAAWTTRGPRAVQHDVANLLISKPELHEAWFERWAQRPPADIAEPIEALITRDDVTDRLGEIDCPAIVFHGDADPAIPLAAGEALHAALARSHGLVRVAGAGHAPNLTHPEQVNPALGVFLRSVAHRRSAAGVTQRRPRPGAAVSGHRTYGGDRDG
jgi:3-oxoadipate enol-lactonase